MRGRRRNHVSYQLFKKKFTHKTWVAEELIENSPSIVVCAINSLMPPPVGGSLTLSAPRLAVILFKSLLVLVSDIF